MEETEQHSGSNKVENTLSIALLAAMSLLPLIEIAGRTMVGQGIPGSIPLVEHLTLWIAFLGAALAARSDRLLVLSTASFLPQRWGGACSHLDRWPGCRNSSMAAVGQPGPDRSRTWGRGPGHSGHSGLGGHVHHASRLWPGCISLDLACFRKMARQAAGNGRAGHAGTAGRVAVLTRDRGLADLHPGHPVGHPTGPAHLCGDRGSGPVVFLERRYSSRLGSARDLSARRLPHATRHSSIHTGRLYPVRRRRQPTSHARAYGSGRLDAGRPGYRHHPCTGLFYTLYRCLRSDHSLHGRVAASHVGQGPIPGKIFRRFGNRCRLDRIATAPKPAGDPLRRHLQDIGGRALCGGTAARLPVDSPGGWLGRSPGTAQPDSTPALSGWRSPGRPVGSQVGTALTGGGAGGHLRRSHHIG